MLLIRDTLPLANDDEGFQVSGPGGAGLLISQVTGEPLA